MKVFAVDFDAQGNPVQQPSRLLIPVTLQGEARLSFAVGGLIGTALWIMRRCSSRITWGPGEQYRPHPQLRSEFHHDAGPEFPADVTTDCVNDIVVGNFDHRNSSDNPRPPLSTPTCNWPCHLTIVIVRPIAIDVRILDVDPATQVSDFAGLAMSLIQEHRPQVFLSTLAAVDLQGRSLRLGPPQKVTVTSSIQPQVVLGMPPMHIDFIQDATNVPNGTPAVLNLTTIPSLFFSQYQTQQSGSAQSANTNTTSYTVGTKESAEAKFSYGIPDVASVSAELKSSAEQTHENTVSAKYNTYTSNTFDVSTQTGFSDLVWFTSKRFNMYIYPVIGQLGCPQSQPTCPDAQKVPLHVVFSGPDQVTSPVSTARCWNGTSRCKSQAMSSPIPGTLRSCRTCTPASTP